MNISHILTVSKYSFYEIYKTKIFFSTLFMGVIIFFFTLLATKLSFGSVKKVSLDISLGLISLSVIAIALSYGVNILKKEIENKTLHAVLSHSVSRSSFLVGKKVGLLAILMVNVLVISPIGLLSFIFFEGEMSTTILLAIVAILIEGGLVLSLGIFFSLFSNVTLAVLAILGILFLSYFIPEIIGTPYIPKNSLLEGFLKTVDYALPQFARLNIKDIVLYEHIVEPYPVAVTFFHSFSYILLLTSMSVIIFKKKDLT